MSQLYEDFPVKQVVDARLISGQWEKYEAKKSSWIEENEPETVVAAHTIAWLVDNGFVHADEISFSVRFLGCTLTRSGLELLKSTPKSIQTQETSGEYLVRLVREGSMEAAKGLVPQLLSLGLS